MNAARPPGSGAAAPEARHRTREALLRHATIDPRTNEREQIGGQVGLLAMIAAIILVGVLPISEALRVPFLTVGFIAAFVIGHAAKRGLDRLWDG